MAAGIINQILSFTKRLELSPIQRAKKKSTATHAAARKKKIL